ncbi:MAG: hypothetical protein SFY96_07925 [Planctomycetota bacterium]|nr:hypothetical protein [Planctomycetota bacterium]
MSTALKPGHKIDVTVTTLPRAKGDADTIERLMRLDPANKKALRTAARKRSQRVIIYNRGNRDWVKREKCARVVRLEKGANWSMTYTADLANEFAAVGSFLEIKSAK